MLKGALISGKISTTVLFISLIILVLFPGISETAANIIILVDGIFLSIAFAEYLITYIARASKFQAVDIKRKKNDETRS